MPEEAAAPELGEPEVEPALAPVPATLPDATSPLIDEPDAPDDGATEPDVGVDPVALTFPELGVPFAPLTAEPDADPDVDPALVEPVPDVLDPDDALGWEKPQAAAPPPRRRTKSVDRRLILGSIDKGPSARDPERLAPEKSRLNASRY